MWAAKGDTSLLYYPLLFLLLSNILLKLSVEFLEKYLLC